jgi:hypothetical protein
MPKKRLPEAKQEQKPDCATRSKREKARPIAKRYGKQGFFRSLLNPTVFLRHFGAAKAAP